MAGSLNFCSIHVSSILTKFSLRLHMIFPLLPSPPWHINDHSISPPLLPFCSSMWSEVANHQHIHLQESRNIGSGNLYFCFLLMEAQVLRRLLETIYVFKYSSSAWMCIFGYLTGLL
ncbi:Uncharacterized protein Adt_31735 [Abeliophyllum distichum]|uniref:Uncharacterized protein n=1 Tax=Abeliophyllum distichum TaxID=126358 RepID=A0ABD1REY0_9LAMI